MKQNLENQVSHDFYQRLKEKSQKKPYAVRFKMIRAILWISSFFGNIASIFFAFFFFISLFTSSFINIDGLGVQVGIVIFLAIFEILKRYVFTLFSEQYLDIGKGLFNKQMASFIISTSLLIGFSFFFSMNGAQKFMNKESVIFETRQTNISETADSMNTYHLETFINPLSEQNKQLMEEKSSILEDRRDYIRRGWNTANFDQQIERIDNRIDSNMIRIQRYEIRKNEEISSFREQYLEKYEQQKSENEWNIIWFLLISATIEFLILIGIYYNKYYQNASIKEYEKLVMSSPNFKKWDKCKNILEMIYETGINVEEQISSTNEIIELVAFNELNISKTEIENAFKIFGHLNIYQRIGNKRILKMEEEDAFVALKKHFKIK
jgi:hypothetical protein